VQQKAGASAGAGWFGGLGFNKSKGPQKASKSFETSLTYSNYFAGKNVIMTGATGGIGSKVARKLVKYGKATNPLNNSLNRRKSGHNGSEPRCFGQRH